jgi:hypothetical protein
MFNLYYTIFNMSIIFPQIMVKYLFAFIVQGKDKVFLA